MIKAVFISGLIILPLGVVGAQEITGAGLLGDFEKIAPEVSLEEILEDSFEATSKNIKLEKIIITSKRTSVGISSVTENVSVLGAEEIEKLPAENLSEVLNYIPGVDIEPRQGFGRTTSLTIRGSDSRHVRLMIDGIPFNNQASGQADPTKFPIGNIERVEIVKGPASNVWGSSLGGVINVITKNTGTTKIPKGSLTVSFAEFRSKKESFDLSGKLNDLGYYLFSSYRESGGEGPKDDVLEKKAFIKLSYDLKDAGRIISSFGYTGTDTNSGELPDKTWEAQPQHIRYGKIGWESNWDDPELKIDFKFCRQNIITRFFNTVSSREPSSIVRTKDSFYELSLNSAIHPRENDLLVLGADINRNALKSIYIAEAKSAELFASYVNYTLKLNPWDFNFGLRYDYTTEFGRELSPCLGAVYYLKNIPETFIRARVSRAFNVPPLLWKYYSGVSSWWDDNLGIDPERAWVYELGLESKPTPEIWYKLSLYRADISDAIDTAQNEAGQYIKKNFKKFRKQGVELQFKINVSKELTFSAGGAFNDVKNRSSGKRVRNDTPRQSFDLGVDYENKRGLCLSLRTYYNRWSKDPAYEPNDRKMISDLKISQKYKNLTFFLNIHNLTNSKYWADSYYSIPERYFEGGVTFNW